jgi:nucleoside-diphosphate-sugar epimerase
MRYFVTGATGLVGTHVVEQLVANGHDVIALTRSRSNANHLPEAVTVVEGDITNKESLREPMTGVDGVFHIAAWFFVGPGPRNVERAERINVEGTHNVLELIDELDVPKAVYTSTVGVYPGTGDERLDETVDPEPPTSAVYFRTKWQAHYEVARPMIDDGLLLVIVQPGVIYGPHDKLYGSARGAFRDYLTGDPPMIPQGNNHAVRLRRGHGASARPRDGRRRTRRGVHHRERAPDVRRRVRPRRGNHGYSSLANRAGRGLRRISRPHADRRAGRHAAGRLRGRTARILRRLAVRH